MDYFDDVSYGVEFENAREAILALESHPDAAVIRPRLPIGGAANGTIIACGGCGREYSENCWQRVGHLHACPPLAELELKAA